MPVLKDGAVGATLLFWHRGVCCAKMAPVVQCQRGVELVAIAEKDSSACSRVMLPVLIETVVRSACWTTDMVLLFVG